MPPVRNASAESLEVNETDEMLQKCRITMALSNPAEGMHVETKGRFLKDTTLDKYVQETPCKTGSCMTFSIAPHHCI